MTLLQRAAARLRPDRLKRAVKRWIVRDRPWVGRLASPLQTVRIEECRFRIDSPVISDALRSRLLYRRYERTERELLRRYLDPSLPVIELGGGIGVVACVVNRRLRDPRNHVVVEANARLLPALEANRDLNRASFAIVNGAIAYGAERALLETTTDLLASRTRAGVDGAVRALQLGQILDEYDFSPCTLVCDIEGAEVELVQNELETLRSRVSLIVVEEHPEVCSPHVRAAMFERLEGAGFVRLARLRKVHALENRRLRGPGGPATSPAGE